MRIAAASGSGIYSGIGNVIDAGATAYSAYPPNTPLGIATTRVPTSAASTPSPTRLDRAERLHARDVGRGDRHRRVAAVDAVDVVEVQRDRVGADEHLARSGRGHVDLVETQDVARRAVLDRSPGAHRAVIYAAGSSASGRFDRPRTLLEYARCIGWRSS